MKLYVYEIESRIHIATIHGTTNSECESVFSDRFSEEEYGATYSPAFGANDGLVENSEVYEINVVKNT